MRYDKKNSFYEIDYSIDEIFRKSGFGKIIIQKKYKNYLKKTIIRANVKNNNKVSIKIFKVLILN